MLVFFYFVLFLPASDDSNIVAGSQFLNHKPMWNMRPSLLHPPSHPWPIVHNSSLAAAEHGNFICERKAALQLHGSRNSRLVCFVRREPGEKWTAIGSVRWFGESREERSYAYDDPGNDDAISFLKHRRRRISSARIVFNGQVRNEARDFLFALSFLFRFSLVLVWWRAMGTLRTWVRRLCVVPSGFFTSRLNRWLCRCQTLGNRIRWAWSHIQRIITGLCEK